MIFMSKSCVLFRRSMKFLGAKVTKTILIDGTKVAPFNTYTPEQIVDAKIDEIKSAATSF